MAKKEAVYSAFVGLALLGCDPEAAPNFAEPLVIELGVPFSALSLEPGDFNGDGRVDLLIGGVHAPVTTVETLMLLGNGDSSFGAGFNPGLTSCSAYPVVGRVTNDNRDDVIAADCPGGQTIWEAGADGSLAPWAAWEDSVNIPIVATVVADFEQDGDTDLIRLRSGEAPTIGLWHNRGGEDFWDLTETELLPTGFEVQRITPGNFDGVGPLDLMITDIGHDVARLVGTSSGEFALPRELGVDLSPWNVKAADMNGDGLDDLVLASTDEASLEVLVNDGSGFAPAAALNLGAVAPWDYAIGDLNGDGSLDVAAADSGLSSVLVAYGDGAGGLAMGPLIDVGSPVIRIHLADVNADDRLDIVAGTLTANTVTIVLNDPA